MILVYIKKHLYVSLLLFIIFILCLINYQSGTFLTGWDTLHPEFDFDLNFKRLFYGVWREEQGLGALAGHSHMADLPRVIILWLLSFIFSLNSLRYLYVFLCLFIGPIGVFYFTKYLVSHQKHAHWYQELIAFVSAIFYLLNLSTVQQFYVPFEMFPTQYAYLPWIMLFSLKYLQEGKRRDVVLFCLMTVLATPQAFAAHLWYPFLGVYGLFLITYSAFHRFKGAINKKSIMLLALTFVMNSYWLLPNLYFIATSSSVPKESKQNRLFSQEFRLRNRENGYLSDVALGKGFYFTWDSYDFQLQQSTPLMWRWQKHLSSPLVQTIGYLAFGVVMLGLITASLKRDRLYLSFVPFFAIPFIILMNHTPPFEQFFEFLLRISLFEEALRFVFTKFSILLVFSYAIFFGYGMQFILRYLSRQAVYITVITTFWALTIFTYPMFQGDLISDKMKIEIPQEYFALWDFMKTQDDGVVLSLPLHSFSGWQYYNWEYQGAGFIWFGLKQAILDRDSDRWSISNEQAFRELQYGLYTRKPDYFFTNLKKFNVQYILWDRSVTSTETRNQQQILYDRETQEILDELMRNGKVKIVRQFGKNIFLYRLTDSTQKSAMQSINTVVTTPYRWNSFDFAYQQHGDYVVPSDLSMSQTQSPYYYPLRSLINYSDRVLPGLINLKDNNTDFTIEINPKISFSYLSVPDFLKTEDTFFADIYIQTSTKPNTYIVTLDPIRPQDFKEPIVVETSLLAGATTVTINQESFVLPSLSNLSQPFYLGHTFLYTRTTNYLNGQPIQLGNGRNEGRQISQAAPLNFKTSSLAYTADRLWETNQAQRGVSLNEFTENALEFESTNETVGIELKLDTLPHDVGYILGFQGKNLKGLPLRVCLKNNYSGLCNLYDELSKFSDADYDYFMIPPLDSGQGYTLHVSNISFGGYKSINRLEKIVMIPIPYNFLSQFYFYNVQQTGKGAINEPTELLTDLPYYKQIYTPSIAELDDNTAVLNQSFHEGWKAYSFYRNNIFTRNLPFIFGSSEGDHVQVNNWANGWRIAKEENGNEARGMYVVLIFWPQYLQFMGFFMIIGTFVWFWRNKEEKEEEIEAEENFTPLPIVDVK